MTTNPDTNELETVTIPKKEYDELVRDSVFLGCLEGAGVDNWDGYSEAYRLMEEENDDA